MSTTHNPGSGGHPPCTSPTPSPASRWYWLPPVGVAAAILTLAALDIRTVFEPTWLMPAVNTVLFVGASALAAVLAGWGFVATGVQTILMLGCGMLAFGLACEAGSVLVSLGQADAGVAAHNTGALVAAAFHLTSAVRLLFPPAAPCPRRERIARVLLLYALAVALLAVVTALATRGLLPRFITPAGTTPVRAAVLAGTAAAYFFSALLFAVQARKAGAGFFRWYWLGLSLIGLGLVGVGLAWVGSPLSWIGRASQSLGQIYILFCLAAVMRERLEADLPLRQRLGISFRQMEMEHAAIWDAAAEGIFVADEGGAGVYANRRMGEILGCASTALLGRPLSTLFLADGSQADGEEIWSRMLREGQAGVEMRCRRDDGVDVPVLVNSSLLRDARDQVSHVVVMVSDLTEHRRAEEALREVHEAVRAQAEALQAANEELQAQREELAAANEELRSQAEDLVEQADRNSYLASFPERNPNPVIETDLAGRVSYANPAALALFPDLKAAGPAHPLLAGIEALARHFQEEGASGVLREVRCGEVTFQQGISYLPDRPALRFYCLDATERRRAEDSLRESEAKYRNLFENMTEEVHFWSIVRDEHGRIQTWRLVDANPPALRTWGKTLDQIRGKTTDEIFGAGAKEHYMEVVQKITTEGVSHSFEDYFPLLDKHFRFTSVPLGEYFITTGADITGTKKAVAQLRDADRRKDEFLAMLGHELRNPLAAVASAVNVLQQLGPADPMLVRARDVAQRQVLHMARLLDDLLDVSRVTQGKIALHKEDVDLALVIESAVEAANPLVEQREQRLFLSVPSGKVRVNADPIRLAQVVGNLLSNAAKYTPDGGEIHVEVRAAELSGGGGEGENGRAADAGDAGDRPSPTRPLAHSPILRTAEIRVRDNGIGIAPDLLPRVFDLFVQGERGPDRSEGGLGLGLTLVRSLVEMHGGSVSAFSEGPGKGSEFVIRLPVVEVLSVPAEVRSEAPAARRILVVDDNADSADMLAMLLEVEGHEVRTVHSGPAALAFFDGGDGQPAPPSHGFVTDAVLLDLGMPGMDGFEVARRLRSEPALAGLLLVAVTGYGQDEDQERSRAAGFDHHLVKPVEMDSLRKVLGTVGEH